MKNNFKHINLKSEHYYFNIDGNMVFTKKYHLDRGYCCNSKCKHCPYNNKK